MEYKIILLFRYLSYLYCFMYYKIDELMYGDDIDFNFLKCSK